MDWGATPAILSCRRILLSMTAETCSVAYTINVKGDTLLVVNNHLESNKLTEKDKAVYREMIKDPDKVKVSEGARIL